MTNFASLNALRSITGAAVAMVLALTFVTAATGPALVASPVHAAANSAIVQTA